MTELELPDVFRRIRRAKVKATPLISLDSPDILSSTLSLRKVLDKWPIVQMDMIRGFLGVNETGRETVLPNLPTQEECGGDPIAQLMALAEPGRLPQRSVVVFQNADAFIGDIKIAQCILNIRDLFKKNGCMLAMLGPQVKQPTWLDGHVVPFDEPLPNVAQMGEMAERVVMDFNKFLENNDRSTIHWDEDVKDLCVDALIGLPSYPAEQLVSMSCLDNGTIDFGEMWQGKISQINKCKGLTVWRDLSNFSKIGGHQVLKDETSQIMTGKRRPRLVVMLDEMEKQGGIANSGGDLSGTNNDQHGALLTFIQDNDVFLDVFVGPAGTGKSEFVKAVGGEHDATVIRFDLGEVKGEGLVGQAGNEIRHALKVIEAMGGKGAMWCGTSNSIAGVSDAMQSRCSDIWFFDLPNEAERVAIWEIQKKRYGLDDRECDLCNGNGLDMETGRTCLCTNGRINEEIPDDHDLAVGRDIAKCCDKADRMGRQIKDVWKSIIVGGKRGRKELDELRREADGIHRSTSYEGPYRMDMGDLEERATRLTELDD